MQQLALAQRLEAIGRGSRPDGLIVDQDLPTLTLVKATPSPT